MKTNNIIFYILFLLLIIFSTPVKSVANETNYYIDISLSSEGYAEFEVDVDNYGNLGGIVVELPTLKCDDNFGNISDLRNKIRVYDIHDKQTQEGFIDLKPKCMGIMITKPSDYSENFTILFTYKNFDWELHPEKYPLDSYNMPILISFPEIKTEDWALVSIRIVLPQNTEYEKISAYRYWEHPANTKSDPTLLEFTPYKRGNEQIILLQSNLMKNNPAQAIFIPLEFKRGGSLPIIFIIFTSSLFVILSLFTFLIYQQKYTDLGLLTIVALLFSYYQFLVIDKPVGVTTWLDQWFMLFILWSMVLFIIGKYKEVAKPQ